MPRFQAHEPVPGYFLPLVMVDFRCNNVGGPAPGLVDSGADQCLIPGQFVEQCGVTFASLPPLPDGIGAGGKFPRSQGTGAISYAGVLLCDEFEVVPPGMFNVILLGRKEFFTKFRVAFNWNESPPTFEIDPI